MANLHFFDNGYTYYISILSLLQISLQNNPHTFANKWSYKIFAKKCHLSNMQSRHYTVCLKTGWLYTLKNILIKTHLQTSFSKLGLELPHQLDKYSNGIFASWCTPWQSMVQLKIQIRLHPKVRPQLRQTLYAFDHQLGERLVTWGHLGSRPDGFRQPPVPRVDLHLWYLSMRRLQYLHRVLEKYEK